jgi:hypothetical protein
MRKRRTKSCGAKPTRESSCIRPAYSIQAQCASALLAVSTDTSRTILSFQEPSMKKLMIAVGVSVLLGACAGGMGMSGSGSSGMSSNPMVGGARCTRRRTSSTTP